VEGEKDMIQSKSLNKKGDIQAKTVPPMIALVISQDTSKDNLILVVVSS
jgi:hypothetical protein